MRPMTILIGLLSLTFGGPPGRVGGAEPGVPPAAGVGELWSHQDAVALRYKEFETVIERMADLLRGSEPDRAALLQKVFAESKRTLLLVEMQELVATLKSEQLGTDVGKSVIERQKLLLEEMDSLLELMLSEDRAQRLRERRERLAKYLEEVEKLKRTQRELRSRTERSGQAGKEGQDAELEKAQGDLADKTGELGKRIGAEDAKADGTGSSKSGGSARGAEAQGSQGEGSQGKDYGSEGSPSDGSGEPSSNPSPDESTPGRESVEDAADAMRKAREKIKELERQKAAESQDEAIRKLDEAIERLEEILRQLREEERLELLRSLASRVNKLLQMQKIVLDQTVSLDRIDLSKRSPVDEKMIVNLSKQEHEIVLEVDKALLVLNEDGTAIAFPEAMVQVREDVVLVESLLANLRTSEFTQGIERDVIEALEDMSESLRREIQEAQDRASQSAPSQRGPMALVDKLAELRMIRSLQLRVKERTDRVARQAEEPNPPTSEIEKAASDLAGRQIRIYGIARDIATGKNQ